MNVNRWILTLLASGPFLGFAGCIDPGRIDQTAINRYQHAMRVRSPQKRDAAKALGLLRPAETIGPKLDVVVQDGRSQVRLTLEEAIVRALANNPQIRVVSFDPAISREEMIREAAAFDYVVFGSYDYDRVDERTASTFGGGQSDTRTLQAGIRQDLITGGSWAASYSLSRVWDSSTFSGLAVRHEPKLLLEVTQPLLRDAWPEFNLARLRIATVNRKISESQFRRLVERIIAGEGSSSRRVGFSGVIQEYWLLWLAERIVPIRRRLLEVTRETLRKVQARAEIDAGVAQIKQAEAAVKTRQIELNDAEKAFREAQDSLARLLSDPQINLLANVEIVPATPPARAKVSLDVADQLRTALAHSPLLEQARLAIARAEITVTMATNQTLPQLDLSGSVGYQGLGATRHEAHEKLGTLDYLSYSIGISFEYPIANRQRRADLRKAILERRKAIAAMQDAADRVARTVRERIREIDLKYREIQLQRELVQAKTLELQALEDYEKIRGRLTPEFLRLKLSTQDQLALARIGELSAITDYNAAIADLALVTGTILKMHGVDIALLAAAGESEWPRGPAAPKLIPVTTPPGKGQ